MFFILKIIGYILLAILIFILLLLSIVLFSPIHYNIKLASDNWDYSIQVNWVFRAVRFIYQKRERMSLHILFFDILQQKKKKNSQPKREKNRKKISEEKKDLPPRETIKKANMAMDKERTADDSIGKTEKLKEPLETNKKKNKENFWTRIKKIGSKIKEKGKQIKELMDTMKSMELEKIINLSWNLFKTLIRNLHIKKFQLTGVIGLSDPSQTGQLIGAYAAIFGMFGWPMGIRGDFENEIMEIDLYIDGKTNLWKLGYPILKYILTEPIKTIIFEGR